MKKKRPAMLKISLEVLQNGCTIATHEQTIKQTGRITLGSSENASLCIPFFPIASQLQIITVNRKGFQLSKQSGWDGFAKINGEIGGLSKDHHLARDYTLKDGDYGTLYIDGLELLFKIGKLIRRTEPKTWRDPAYRGSFFSLFIQGKSEVSSLLGGTAFALAVFALIFVLSAALARKKPEAFEDLQDEYVAQFFNPTHLLTSPEALQNLLIRSNYYRSVGYFYRAFAAMLIGEGNFGGRYMFDTSKEVYRHIISERNDEIIKREGEQQEVEKSLLAKQGTAIISIPSAKGESIRGSIIRIFDKTEHFHAYLFANLEDKKIIRHEFPHDNDYNFGKYKDLDSANPLGKISPFQLLTNEETMYKTAKDLAKKSAISKTKMMAHRSDLNYISAKSPPPVGIPANVNFASFLNNASLLVNDTKIDAIRASTFGKAKKEIKEPLIGEIEPQLIEKVIKNNKYELQLCYELALRRNQTTGGEMEWSWRVDSRGKISEIELVATNIRDRTMARCIKKKIEAWHFPRPRRGSVEISYPFQFSKSSRG